MRLEKSLKQKEMIYNCTQDGILSESFGNPLKLALYPNSLDMNELGVIGRCGLEKRLLNNISRVVKL